MENIYVDGSYLDRNPSWHSEDSLYKANEISLILARNGVSPRTIAEIGCGAGGILKALEARFPNARLSGYDISPQAIKLARRHESDRLRFFERDPLASDENFDVLIAADVVEHVPDYMGFLSRCSRKARHLVYLIPLEMHVSGILRDAYMDSREKVGHLHYFSEASAKAALRDTGHAIVDVMYDRPRFWPSKRRTMKRLMADVPRWLISRVSDAWGAKLLGSYALLALCRPRD